MTLVSVVVPVYFSSATLPTLLNRLREIDASLPALDFEFVMVDDGSTDNSFAILQAEAAGDARVRALRLSRNFGSNVAILAGLNYARGDACVVIAADLQDPPELIPELIQKWQGGTDIVLAARASRDDPFVSRIFAAGFNRLFRKFVFRDFPKDGFDFMLVSQRVARQIVAMNERNSYIFGQIMWVGYSRDVVYYHRAEREHGKSTWTTAKKIKYFIDAFTAFSYLPVRAATLLGFALGFLGFVWAFIVIIARLLGLIQESGFAAVMVALLVLSGTQLVVSGLIGEYLWRILEESRNRPTFLVAQTANVDLVADGVGPSPGWNGFNGPARPGSSPPIAHPSARGESAPAIRSLSGARAVTSATEIPSGFVVQPTVPAPPLAPARPSSPAPTDASEGVGPR